MSGFVKDSLWRWQQIHLKVGHAPLAKEKTLSHYCQKSAKNLLMLLC